jgi:hypothetical protein
VQPAEQFLDIVYHAELGLDEHIDTIYHENDMDPHIRDSLDVSTNTTDPGGSTGPHAGVEEMAPEAFVLFEQGTVEQRVVHDEDRIERRRMEREREAFAQRYAQYAQTTKNPVPFEQYLQIMRMMGE